MKASLVVGCGMPGCAGTVEDGYCDVCGAPAGAVGSPSPARLAVQAFGSARPGSGRARRTGPALARLRGRQLGAGLTTVPPTPVGDPWSTVMADPVVPAHHRVCPACRNLVGQGQDGDPGRVEGFCAACGTRFDFRPTLVAGDMVGQYQVVGPLAHGGMGWIYLAKDRNLSDRPVVLKGLLNSGDPDLVAAAVAERQFLATVEHPEIVQVHNFVTFAGQGYIVMDWVGGKSLAQILAERCRAAGRVDPLPVDRALAYVLEILPAVRYLHERGLLYCDFKPANLISEDERVTLIDLGGVRRADDDTSAVFGTVGYQAPEVPTDGPSVASDIFTIGRTLATLVLDFKGNTTTYATTLPPVGQHPVLVRYDSFYHLLAKACALNPDDRFASVDELRVQMLGVLREVVATDRGLDRAARGTTTSLLFGSPTADVADRPLRATELPPLRTDDHDPMHTWLTGVTVDSPGRRFETLTQAPQTTPAVLLAQAQTAVAAAAKGRHQESTKTVYSRNADGWWGFWAAGTPEDAEKWSRLAQMVLDRWLDLDPWDWRAMWLSGLSGLDSGDVLAARASFNAVYGQVPGELAPKLALATACELSDELQVAESLYQVCAATDTAYTSPAAFGLARIRQRRGDTDGALAALDLVSPTQAAYAQVQTMRTQIVETNLHLRTALHRQAVRQKVVGGTNQ
ncbi:MAG: serine/threonine-protein kinase PknG [Micrococcales bacterium]|nr:serine/threonine-protein kinase PknG [Micrococcales bacterium]